VAVGLSRSERVDNPDDEQCRKEESGDRSAGRRSGYEPRTTAPAGFPRLNEQRHTEPKGCDRDPENVNQAHGPEYCLPLGTNSGSASELGPRRREILGRARTGSATRSNASAISPTAKYGREKESPGPRPRAWIPIVGVSERVCHPSPSPAWRASSSAPRNPVQKRLARSGSWAGNSTSDSGEDATDESAWQSAAPRFEPGLVHQPDATAAPRSASVNFCDVITSENIG
jgi:hypothetical protein